MKFIVTAEAGYHGEKKPTLWIYSESKKKKIATFANEGARQEFMKIMENRLPIITSFEDEKEKGIAKKD